MGKWTPEEYRARKVRFHARPMYQGEIRLNRSRHWDEVASYAEAATATQERLKEATNV